MNPLLDLIDSLFPLPTVQVGINPDMAKNKCHGVAWVEGEDGGVSKQPFIVDKPDRLKNPNSLTINAMFQQVSKMGMIPRHLEILVDQKITVYQFGRRKPIVALPA